MICIDSSNSGATLFLRVKKVHLSNWGFLKFPGSAYSNGKVIGLQTLANKLLVCS
jgi:hypothetical protein